MNPAVGAIFKANLKRWFANPTGYVFLALFVMLASAALFWPDQFFQSNLANLDTLNLWFPRLLLFFIPAVTMGSWAGERGQGTDELLLTLPASELQIVLGKYLAAAGIYTIALVFTVPLLFFIAFLGDPDWGLMLSNYVGFWLLGLVLVGAGMVGSQLTDNLTVAFILGAILCALVIMAENIVAALFPHVLRAWVGYGPVSLFRELSRGVISLPAVLLFVGLILGFLYLNLLLLTRRHWRRGRHQGAHMGVRFGCLVAGAIALTGIGANAGWRLDVTAERIHSLSDETLRIIEELPEARPVLIQAYLSPEVPRDYVQTKRTLADLLRQYDAMGGDAIRVRIVETERYSEEAREAEKKFGIQHETRVGEEEGKVRPFDLYMGIAFTCGLEEVVIPFVDKGLSVEYELTRSLRVVASAARPKVGILDTDAKLFGGFDFQTFRRDPEWAIVRELKLQYDVERVDPGSEYPGGLDVLLAAMPSSLTQEELDRLGEAIREGTPTLLIDDPFPTTAPDLGPTEPKGGQRNPFMGNQPPPQEKGNIRQMLRSLNIRWPCVELVWDTYNPHPQFSFEPEVIFLGSGSGSSGPFNQRERVTSGLQEVVTIFGGHLEDAGLEDLQFIPLLRTTKVSGVLALNEAFRPGFFGGRMLDPRRPHHPDGKEKILACRVRGTFAEEKVHLIFIADLDMVSEQFFELRRQGIKDFQFDNVTFLLNCVDELAGDASFIELRKRRPKHRTLTTLEEQEKDFNENWLSEKQKAEAKAEADLAEAQSRLDERIREVEKSAELDEQSKAIRIQSIKEVEQRRFDLRKAAIEDEKDQAIELAQTEKLRSERVIRNFYKIWALALAPIPAVLVGLLTFLRRRRRERETSLGVG